MISSTCLPHVHQATGQMFTRYLAILADAELADDGSQTGPGHLKRLCEEGLRLQDIAPIDKLSRWLGFIQGVLCAKGLLQVDAERDVSRPLFHRAYEADGVDTPPTIDARQASTTATCAEAAEEHFGDRAPGDAQPGDAEPQTLSDIARAACLLCATALSRLQADGLTGVQHTVDLLELLGGKRPNAAVVIAPADRGIAELGRGRYITEITHADGPAGLLLRARSPDAPPRRPGDPVTEADLAQIADEACIHLRFMTEDGIDVLQRALERVRQVHFAPAPGAAGQAGVPASAPDAFDAFLAELRSTPEGRDALEEGMRWVQEKFYGAAPLPAPSADAGQSAN